MRRQIIGSKMFSDRAERKAAVMLKGCWIVHTTMRGSNVGVNLYFVSVISQKEIMDVRGFHLALQFRIQTEKDDYMHGNIVYDSFHKMSIFSIWKQSAKWRHSFCYSSFIVRLLLGIPYTIRIITNHHSFRMHTRNRNRCLREAFGMHSASFRDGWKTLLHYKALQEAFHTPIRSSRDRHSIPNTSVC